MLVHTHSRFREESSQRGWSEPYSSSSYPPRTFEAEMSDAGKVQRGVTVGVIWAE